MSDLSLLTALLPSDPSLVPLLRSRSTLSHPSRLSSSDVHKFLNKLGSFVCIPVLPGQGKSSNSQPNTTTNASSISNSSSNSEEWKTRRDAWIIAKLVLEMDTEGYILGGGWGKTWLLNLLGSLNNNTTPTHSLPLLIPLLTTLHTYSLLSPTYQRTISTPNLLKTSQGVVTVLKRALTANSDSGKQQHEQHQRTVDPKVVRSCLTALPLLISLNPTPHRPLLPTLLPLLHSLLLSPFPSTTPTPAEDKQQKHLTAKLLARLHTLSGKVAAGVTFRGDLSGMIRESNGIVDVLFGSLYQTRIRNQQVQVQGSSKAKPENPLSASQPIHPGRPEEGVIGDLSKPLELRVRGLGRCLDGWVEGVLGMLRFETARPVAFPLGSLIALGLKCLSLTPETQTEETLDVETRALALRLKSKIWGCGMKILGAAVIAAGDHVLSNVGLILDKSVFLLETLSKTDHSTRIALFKFHALLLTNLQLDPSSSSFHTRLMKQALTSVSLVLDTKTPALASSQAKESAVDGVLGKKGKKRARGAGEEVVVAGIEGRGGRGLTRVEGEVVLSALRLLKVLHHHPSIPPHLLALSIRIHLSIAHTLESKTATAVSQQDLSLAYRLSEAVAESLEDAMTIEGSGVKQGWIGSIVKQESMARSSVLPLLLHPTAPPLSRPLPPVSTLAFYAVDAEEEEALRKEIGLRTADEAEQAVVDLNEGNFDMDEGEDRHETSRSYKRVAMGDTNSVTRSNDLPAQYSKPMASMTANSVFGSGASTATVSAAEIAPPVAQPVVPLSVPSIDSASVAVEIPPVKETVNTHQPAKVGVKDDADVAAAAMTEPFSSITTDLPARAVNAEPTVDTHALAEFQDEDDDAIPEINVDSDSEEEDDEDMA